jgi:hypothetical protein
MAICPDDGAAAATPEPMDTRAEGMEVSLAGELGQVLANAMEARIFSARHGGRTPADEIHGHSGFIPPSPGDLALADRLSALLPLLTRQDSTRLRISDGVLEDMFTAIHGHRRSIESDELAANPLGDRITDESVGRLTTLGHLSALEVVLRQASSRRTPAWLAAGACAFAFTH